VGNGSHFLFRQKLLREDGSVRRGFVMVEQPGLFSPQFKATSSHVFTQSLQKSQQNPESTVWSVRTGAWRYLNCCIDGGTIPEYCGYHPRTRRAPLRDQQIKYFIYSAKLKQRIAGGDR
jgi:hypothetical protein